MSLVYMTYVLRLYLVVADINAVNRNIPFFSEKLGVEIKGRFQSVFIKDVQKTLVLNRSVVVAERNSLHFTVEHFHTSKTVCAAARISRL